MRLSDVKVGMVFNYRGFDPNKKYIVTAVEYGLPYFSLIREDGTVRDSYPMNRVDDGAIFLNPNWILVGSAEPFDKFSYHKKRVEERHIKNASRKL